MYRYKIIVQYIGSAFRGWASQSPGHYTVQSTIQKAISEFCPYSEANVIGAGRTDSGVHATGQVFHVDLVRRNKKTNTIIEEPFGANIVTMGLNFYLRGHDIQVIKSNIVDNNFHARYSAIAQNRAYLYQKPLDIDKMNTAAKYLEGRHDFTALRAPECASPTAIREVFHCSVTEKPLHSLRTFPFVLNNKIQNSKLIEFKISATSFLYHQVRIIMSRLIRVGNGKCSLNEFMDCVDHHQTIPLPYEMVPSHGLYLHHILYPKPYGDEIDDKLALGQELYDKLSHVK